MPRHGNETPLFVFKLSRSSDPRGISHGERYAFLIAAKRLKLRSSANGSVYKLCDIVERFPEVVDCSGIERQLTIILKIYAKIPEAKLKKQREMRRYESLAKGKWVFSEE